MKIINPNQIMNNRLPLFVFSDDRQSFFNWGIRKHTKGNWPHSMIMIRPGFFATQGMTFKEVPVEYYMSGRFRLKFWKYEWLSGEIKLKIIEAVRKDLKASKLKRFYDWLGILGHLFRAPWFQSPWQKYCHERQAKYAQLIPEISHLVPSHPANLNKVFKGIEKMKIIGYYDKEMI